MKPHDVIIVGGGPAGLAAARRLARAGLRDVVVVEREAEPGGVPRHCGHGGFGIAEFGWPMSGPAYARRLAAGIEVRTRTTVTALEADGQLRISHPDAGSSVIAGRRILLATGLRETPRSARLVSGGRPWGIMTTGALQQFVYLTGERPCTRLVVVGTELVAFSVLLTARHAGISVAAMLEEGERIVARKPGDWIARGLLGVPVLLRRKLVAIHGIERVEGVAIERAGRRETIACDGVVFTGRFQPETALLCGGPIALDSGTGGPSIDQTYRCTDPRYFAAGNLLRPVETAGFAAAEGRAAADGILASLRDERRQPSPPDISVTCGAPIKYVYPQRLAPIAGPLLPLRARVDRAARGRLRLLADGREIWSRRVAALPERRITLPAAPIPRSGIAALHVDLVEE